MSKAVAKAGKPVATTDRDMGEALRDVYKRTVDEPIPPDFLSLLDKLD